MNLPFRNIWCVDFEYRQPDGELPAVHCLVAVELRTGRLVRQWFDEFTDTPPYDIGPDSLAEITQVAAASVSQIRHLQITEDLLQWRVGDSYYNDNGRHT